MKEIIELIGKQKKLDIVIRERRNLQGIDLTEEKAAAMVIELGEMANELPEYFKHWSSKRNNYKKALEEYVDGLHLLLSLGVEKGIEPTGNKIYTVTNEVIPLFNKVITAIGNFSKTPIQRNYQQLFTEFIRLGKSLGFEKDQIVEEYRVKNKINHLRQQQGY